MSDNISQDVAISGEGNIVVGKGDVIINPLPPAETRLRHDLGILLKNVETTWIKGVLEKSVHQAALLELGMELREEAIDSPWRMVMEGPNHARETLPRGSKIKDIFYEANGLLLILGAPGSGKTTTLLQLARDLIAELDKEFSQPVPVILNLSTWTNKQQPLDEWLVAELNSKYRLPKKGGMHWLQKRRILPLLDGLDEVKSENRTACVDKINQLVSDYGLQGLVVCSRIKDYTDLNIRLAFYRAIYLQPLSPEQVDEYLERAGENLASLRATLQGDDALRNMAQTPLILNIMSLAYQNTSAEELGDPALATDKARHQRLFDTYINRMMSRKVTTRLYDDKQIKQWLSWLARNMQRHNQEVFLIEGLQPSWISVRYWQWFYLLASRLILGLIVGLLAWLFVELVVVGGTFPEPPNIVFLFFLGLSLGFIDIFWFEWIRKRMRMKNFFPFWWTALKIIVVGLVSGLTYRLTSTLPNEFDLRIGSLLFGSFLGLVFGLRGSRQNLENDIQPVEALHWSWNKGLIGGLIGAISALVFMLIIWNVNFYLGSVALVGLLFGSIGVILNGLRPAIIETKSIPNQGIRLSIRNSILGGLILGLVVGLVYFLILFLLVFMAGERLTFADISFFAQTAGLLFLGVFAPMGALWYGGFDTIQHYILRVVLVIQGYIPRDFARFLDYAVDRILLQKVGGGYRFIHRLLLEHFAGMGEAKKQ